MKSKYLLLALLLNSGCTNKQQTVFSTDYILDRCSKFKTDSWTPADLADQELEALNAIEREMRSQPHQAWFKNESGRIGLCEFRNASQDINTSCDSTYTEFMFLKGTWAIENESIVICSRGRY